MLQGVIKLPSQQWSWSKHQIFHVPIFSQLMTWESIVNHPNLKLVKFYELMVHFLGRFCDLYTPEQTLWMKGRLGWKMYIAKKRARFGLKFFILCESESGYICDFLLYTGQGTV
ncbi:hypothetical protein J437_LFUL013019 [Ladona fulva]|uniref:PiggyBac transposable element-derived protein domain-containing protein n=1 Tax=Ladona fulva TaxID=123851 RepID=A0A8K0KLB8_LADFU|nr:hypothetical protein J437_LFUL013019 [Ladona fulva]